jgi:octaprenyl-diphosphate synthase
VVLKTISLSTLQAPVQAELEAMNQRLGSLRESNVELIRRVGDHILNGGGKQFRPTLLLLVARLGGQSADLSVLAATVVELIHTATLIHDDSVDGSSLRRGRPTVNRAFNDSISIIMGDFVYSKAFAILAEKQLFPLIEVLAHSTHQMSRGEMVEMDLKEKPGTTEAEYLEMIEGKTAALFQAACEIGAYLGFAGGERDRFKEFGRALGMAFQITDDLMDIAGDEEIIGKDRGNDLREGKVTLPYIAALRNSSAEERSRFERILSQPDKLNGDAATLLQWIRGRGGETYARGAALQFARRAQELLAPFPDGETRQALMDAAAFVVDRPL